MSASTPAGGQAESVGAAGELTGAERLGRPSALRSWLRTAAAVPGAEHAGVLAAVLVVAALGFGGHVLHGGYYLDDWKSLELSQHLGGGGISGSISRHWDYSGFRPVSSLYRALLWSSPLGTHMRLNIAFAVFSAAGMSVLLYASLRAVRMAGFDAAAIAALVVACPLADSTRLWVSASLSSMNISLYLVGLLLAIRGLRATSTRSQVRWHAAAAVVYLASVLFAESTAALVVATGLLYWVMRGFRAAVARTAVDATLVLAAALWISDHDPLTPRSATTMGALWSRATTMGHELPSVLGGIVDPYGGGRWFAFLAVVVLGAGAALTLVRPAGDAQRTRALAWLGLAVAGLIVAISGWVIYLPADAYYRPEQVGIGNRINSLPAIGLVFIAYAAVRVAALLVTTRAPSASSVATILTGLVALVVLAGFVRESRADSRIWDRAYVSEQTTLGFVLSRVPHPPPQSTIYVVRQPQFETPEVPIFVSWDFRPALRFAYGNAPSRLEAWAVPWSVPFYCEAGRIFPRQWGWTQEQGARYGNVWVVDVATRATWHVTDGNSCRNAAAAVKALPMARWVASVPNYPDAG